MELHVKNVLWLLLLCLAISGADGQEAQGQQGQRNGPNDRPRDQKDMQLTSSGPQTLTRSEGLAILRTAMDFRTRRKSSGDCSHFVHGLYQRAGFPYTYASSSELYSGVGDFRRVTNPQAGDLIVWPGHAGIVSDPAHHSFLSVMHNGPGVDRYDSRYWRRRGRPHFLRYVRRIPAAVRSSSLRKAGLRPTAGSDLQGSDLQDDRLVDGVEGEGSSTQKQSWLESPEKQTVTSWTFSPIVHSPRPKAEQVSAAFLQACTEAEQNLRDRDLFKSEHTVIVFERFQVRKVHLRENQNWAEVQIAELASVSGGEAEMYRHSERQRWPLIRRDSGSWDLTPPQDTIYVPHNVAVRMLQHGLASLAKNTHSTVRNNQEQADLSRVLDALLAD
jgi:hypothetical protein